MVAERLVTDLSRRAIGEAGRAGSLRVAINLLTEDPTRPSGAHWFWTRMLPEMAKRLESGEELLPLVSRKSRHLYGDYGDEVQFTTFPWSNERRNLRTLSEHLYLPVRLPFSHIDIFNTLMAPVVNPSWTLVIHIKTLHAYTTPQALRRSARIYRQLSYPRSARKAQRIIINSNSLRAEIEQYLDVDPRKLQLIYEAVDHDLFRLGDREAARAVVASHGVTRPFVLFVSSLWPYKNCEGLLRGWARARSRLGSRQLAIVGGTRNERYAQSLRSLAAELGIADDVVFVGRLHLEQTVDFYRAADLFVYPSLNETFGLPILEAMACGCPVATSNVSAMPETAGGAAVLFDPNDPASIAQSIVDGIASSDRLRDAGLRWAAKFNWGNTAAATLDVYREVGALRRAARGKP